MHYDVFISYNSADKTIADAVCHHLEERRLRCFIAPRDIVPPDWAGSITAAIEHSSAFVIVVSEHAMTSNEVAKEITLATRVSSYIFPFRVDDTLLDGRMTYHLSAFHWIDAVTPPMERRMEELADRICAALSSAEEGGGAGSSRNTQRQRVLGQRVSPRAEFAGRERELQEIQGRFDGGSQAVFLCGMGGIGKSEIAKAYARDHAADYAAIVFASYETDLLHLIASDQSLPVENLSQISAAGGQGETLQDYYQRKMKVLRAVTSEKTLLIIDNFDVETDAHLSEVLALPCRFLITTRVDFSPYGYETIRVGAMENFDDLVTLFSRIDRTYAAPEDRRAVEEIIRLLDCHTYAVSLTAAQMKAGRIKPTKMLSQLREQGLHIQTRSAFARDTGAGKATAYQYIEALFDFSRLDEEACRILRYLSCVPKEGADADLFMECAGLEDFGDVSRLIELNWVQLNEESDRVGLHMLIREMVWDKLRPTLANCAPLLEGVRQRVWNAWNQPYEENRRMEGLVYALMERFPQPTAETLLTFEQYATFAWIEGNFDLSETCERRLYELCEETFGGRSREAGNQAMRVAAVFHNKGDYAGARPWYERGWQALREACGDTHETAAACMKVGRSDAQSGDLQAAEEKYVYGAAVMNRQWEAVDRTNPAEVRTVNFKRGVALMELAHVYACEGQGEKALPLALEAETVLKDDTQEAAVMIYVWMVLSYVYCAMGDYAEAERYIGRAIGDNLRFHSEIHLDTLHLTEIQGDILSIQGRYAEAGEAYAKVLGGRETHFPSDDGAIARLERKYTCAKAGESHGMPLLDIWP